MENTGGDAFKVCTYLTGGCDILGFCYLKRFLQSQADTGAHGLPDFPDQHQYWYYNTWERAVTSAYDLAVESQCVNPEAIRIAGETITQRKMAAGEFLIGPGEIPAPRQSS